MKPSWLVDNERSHDEAGYRVMRLCISCAHKGKPCGLTNKTGKGRMVMYECDRFPGVTFHEKTYACQSYERANSVR